MFIEPLESRIAPAVILNLTLGKTGAILAEEPGSTGDNVVSVAVDANGALHVDPADPNTQIRFDGVLLPIGDTAIAPGFTGKFTAKLGAGNDQLTISGSFPGATTVDLGLGTNTLIIDTASLGGKLTVKGGTGNDTVTFSGATTRVFGGVNLALGEGVNTLNNTTTQLLHIGGDFIATSGKANDDFLMAGNNVQILGSLSLSTGTGEDDAGFAVSGRLEIGGNVALKGVGSTGERTDQTLSGTAGIFVGGALAMDLKKGQQNQNLSSPGTIFIGGAARFSGGGKDNFGSAEIVAATLHIGGLLSAKTKSVDSEFSVRDVSFGSLVGGIDASGFTDTTLQISGFIGGAVKVALAGPGQSGYFFLGTVLNAADPLYVGAVSVKTTTDDATMSLLNVIAQGAVNIKGSRGDDFFGIDDVLFLAPAKVDMGGGDDTFGIESGLFPNGLTQVNATLTLIGGAGEDRFDLSGGMPATWLNAVANIIIDGGSQDDTVNLGVTGDYQPKVIQKNI